MYKTILTLAAFLSFNHLYSQISYKVNQDNPFLKVHVGVGGFFDYDFLDKNSRSATNAILQFHPSKRIMLGGEVVWANKKNDKVIKESATEIKATMFEWNGRLSLFPSAKVKSKQVKIVLESASWSDYSYNYSYENYIFAPAKTLYQYGFTFSAGSFTNNFLDSKNDSLLLLVNKTSGLDEYLPNTGTTYTGMRFSAGVVYSETRNFSIDAKDKRTGNVYGDKVNRGRTEFIAEIVAMPTITVTKDLVAKETGTEYTLKTMPELKNIGYRIRLEQYSTGVLALGYHIEFGQRPGILYRFGKKEQLRTMYFKIGISAFINGMKSRI